MSQQAAMLRSQYRRLIATISAPEPAFPWHLHDFNPSPPPVAPVTNRLKGDPALLSGAAPVMWPHQCRDCWGWVDDPRHLTPHQRTT